MHSNSVQSKRKLFATGQSGFVGSHILRLAAEQSRLSAHYAVPPAPPYDLLAPDSLDAYLRAEQPDAVIHLAGQTFIPEAFADPAATLKINLLGTLNLLEALKRNAFRGTFLYVSSGDVYGRVPTDELPIAEDRLPKPQNPYAVSKAAAELLCYQWSRTEQWRIVVARPFNHIGAGQRADFVIANIARQIVRIKHGLQPPTLSLGDVDVTRDFIDVEDVIDAYLNLLEHGASGETYNVCSGQEHSIRELVTTLLELAGVQATITQDPSRYRPTDQRRVAGDSRKLRELADWRPKPITDALRAILLDWEKRYLDD
ncbi:MAG TPA: GDP-mannose 4,6-dehydratase [Spongiibacteraceae bacterium]|nr:GDP-mannose 4,6-dehydratase [Spongiibacteraceae bacterium]